MFQRLHFSKVIAAICILFLCCAIAGRAQVTTSSISGIATDSEGTLPGAVITAIHMPSGTRYVGVTNTEGAYRIEGLRSGGPYRVEASFVGHKHTVLQVGHLKLGAVHQCDVRLPEGSELAEVVIEGKAALQRKTGSTEHITSETIESIPVIDRWIDDITRLSPYFMGNTFAGRDQSTHNYSVDGANFNFNMGLDRGRLPADNRPISVDALEEVQIVHSAFDVKNSNFLGAAVNMVTKRGTNTFKGSAYTYFKNENLRGNKIDGEDLGEREREQRNIWGMTLGGPIIKDRLFFFVNAEYEHSPYPVYKWRHSADGKGDGESLVSRVTDEDMARFAGDLNRLYGWDPGSWTDYGGEDNVYRLLARIDYNISDHHHLMLRYNFTDKKKDNAVSGGGLVGTPASVYSQTYAGSMYSRQDNVHSLTAELNSSFGRNMNNVLRAGFTFNNANNRESDAGFPTIEIQKTDEGGVNRPFLNAGYDQHAYKNGVKERSWNIEDNFTMLLGKHFLTLGTSFESVNTYNSYMRYGAGYYRYNSYDDFLNGAAPSAFAMSYSLTGDDRPKAEVGYRRWALYAQDEWRVNPRLQLLYALRMDLPIYTKHRYENPSVAELDFNGERLNTANWPKTRPAFSPRFGFNYDVLGNGHLIVRGGTGIFTGRFSLIYLSKMQENSGMLQNMVQFTGNHAVLPYLAGGVRTPEQILTEVVPGLPDNLKSNFPTQPGAKNNLVSIDRNFKMPQVWKSTLAADYKLPLPFDAVFTVEGTFAKDINAITAYDANIDTEKIEATHFGGNDNRIFYPGATNKRIHTDNGFAYVMTNTSKGYSASMMTQLKANPVDNLWLMAAYTYTVSKTLNSMPSNQIDGWDCKNQASVNGFNYLEMQNARYIASPHRLIASASYKVNYARNHASTMVSLFYEGRKQGSYGYTYSQDMNNDGIKGNDLLYVPATKDELLFKDIVKSGNVVFTAEEQREAFWAFVNQDKYLSSRKGQYTENFGAFNPWLNRFDLKLVQEFQVKVGKNNNRLQVMLDIYNVGNLLNNKWGVRKVAYEGVATQPLTRVGVDADNTPIYNMTTYTDKEGVTRLIDHTFIPYLNTSCCWQMQIGVRYIFN